jgi:hypothetical protein
LRRSDKDRFKNRFSQINDSNHSFYGSLINNRIENISQSHLLVFMTLPYMDRVIE